MGLVVGTAAVIRSRRFNRAAHADEILSLLGVKSLPVEGMAERLIDGIRVYVKPLNANPGVRRNWQGFRVMAICACGRHVPVGRLSQHKCK